MSASWPETVEIRRESAQVPYRDALTRMDARNRAIAAGEARRTARLTDTGCRQETDHTLAMTGP